MKARVTGLAAALLSVLLISSGRAADLPTKPAWTILTSPLRVDALVFSTSTQGYSIQFVLHGEHADQTVRTFIPPYNVKGGLPVTLRSAVESRPPYLFVKTECNNPQADDCIRQVAFKVVAGDAILLGQLLPGHDGEPPYEGGIFADYWGGRNGTDYDWGLCMACLPYVKVIMTETYGYLKVLPEKTWAANKADWNANEKKMATLRRDKNGSVSGNPDYYQALVENAVIDKYCARNAELTQLLAAWPRNDDLIKGLGTMPVLQPPSNLRRRFDLDWYE